MVGLDPLPLVLGAPKTEDEVPMADTRPKGAFSSLHPAEEPALFRLL